ncbi:reverse transcriptase [Yersinia phage fEV-1]|nr:reverse transcriptase [Yersinia phage fEV-1]
MQGNLFDKIISIDNLRAAHRKARKGKSHYKEVQWVDSNEQEALERIQRLLIDGTFKTSKYTVEHTLKGDKMRTIHKLPYFPDRIVQHAIVNVCSEAWTRSMIRDTFQSIKGRGTTDCFRRTRNAIQQHKPRYSMKIDIRQFYPSAKPEHVLKPHVFRIKCERTFALLSEIINSLPFLPLGNHTSQYAGNLLLSPIDWYVKQKLGVKFYYRYCDDIVILHDDINYLRMVKEIIRIKLAQIDLVVKDDIEIRDLNSQYLDFVGYRTNHHGVLLRKRLVENFKHACRTCRKQALPSYYGWIKHANAKRIWHKHTRCHRWKLS